MSAASNKQKKVPSKGKLRGGGGVAVPAFFGELKQINVAEIIVLPGRRAIDPDWVEALAVDIAARGQTTPIEVCATNDGYRLVAGAHRLAAFQHNFHTVITAVVKQPKDYATEADIKLDEIAENFLRRELSVLDRAVDVAAWREIFEAVQGAVKRGGDRRSKKAKNQSSKSATLMPVVELQKISEHFSMSFTEASRQALGLGRDAVFRALRIAAIEVVARGRIALHPMADNQSELLALAAQPDVRQGPITQLILSGEAANVAAAIATIDKLPALAGIKPWQKVVNGFSALPEKDQALFFEVHNAAIIQWQADRKGGRS